MFLISAALIMEVAERTDLNVADNKAPKAMPVEPSATTEVEKIVVPANDRNANRVTKAPEIVNQEVDLICRDLNRKFETNKIENLFARVDFKFHEKRLKSMKFNDRLKTCFKSATTAKTRVEIDVFSADFQGEHAADLISFQVSVFDKKTRNKIFEAGQKLDLSSAVDLPTKAEGPAN